MIAKFSLHNKTKKFPELIHIHCKCLRKQPKSWHFLYSQLMHFSLHKEILYFSNRITQAFLGNFKPKQFPHLENKNKRVKTY